MMTMIVKFGVGVAIFTTVSYYAPHITMLLLFCTGVGLIVGSVSALLISVTNKNRTNIERLKYFGLAIGTGTLSYLALKLMRIEAKRAGDYGY